MPLKQEIGERIYYFLPKRVTFAFAIIQVIVDKEKPTTTQIMDETGFSRPYINACLNGLKKNGVINSTKGAIGGYYLAKSVKKTTVVEVLEAISKPEDRSFLTRTLYKLIMNKIKNLTLKELLES